MYKTIAGDTFELIARKSYGTEVNADRIARANPGVVEPLSVGTDIIIPDTSIDDKVQNTDQVSNTEVAVLIDGKRFRFWSDLRLSRSIDTMDIVHFSAPFDALNKEFRNIFRPFSFKRVVITVGGIPLFTGVMLTPVTRLDSLRKTVDVSCYSLPGVLNDSAVPASAYPVAYDDLTLKELASTLCEPFGISVKFTAPFGGPIERVSIDSKKRILAFLIGQAKQHNLVISNTSKGELLFQQSIEPGNPVAIFRQGTPPLQSVIPIYNPQSYYSHITGIRPTETGRQGLQYTVKNPRLSGVLRVMTFEVPDVPDADVKLAVEARMGRMFANMVSYNITVPTWHNSDEELWKPNTTVILHAHDAMIWTDYEFVVRSVEFRNDGSSFGATMNLVLPGAFSGKIPESLPWDE